MSKGWPIFSKKGLPQHLHSLTVASTTLAHSTSEGRKELKRYGALFTCLSSRAEHIEAANPLEADSFLNALRRFIARRGPVREIRSDQGTNITGAEKELQRALSEMDNNAIQRSLCTEFKADWVQWKQNPPSASHMGGVWERQIRSVRSILTALMRDHGRNLDDESFRTLMAKVECVINSTPLTTPSSDPRDLDPLTPNHILTMKSKKSCQTLHAIWSKFITSPVPSLIMGKQGLTESNLRTTFSTIQKLSVVWNWL